MTFGVATRVIAAILALCAFAIGAISGAAAGNDAARVLAQSLISMVLCYLLGLALGSVAERTVREYIDEQKAGASAPDRELNPKRASE